MNYHHSPYYAMPYYNYPYMQYPYAWPCAPISGFPISRPIENNNFGHLTEYGLYGDQVGQREQRYQAEVKKCEDSEKIHENENFFVQDPIENLNSVVKSKKIKKKEKNIEKQSSAVQSIAKEGRLSRRQQTANRNLNSNTLKVYFKQLRDPKTETSLSIHKIIETNKIGISHQKFVKKVNSVFPSTCTYISLDQLKKKLESTLDQEEHLNFIKILRTSIKRFFNYEIFTVNFKSARTTRRIRNQQIKQGKIILRELSL